MPFNVIVRHDMLCDVTLCLVSFDLMLIARQAGMDMSNIIKRHARTVRRGRMYASTLCIYRALIFPVLFATAVRFVVGLCADYLCWLCADCVADYVI